MERQTSNIKQQTLRIGFDAKRAFNNGTGLGNYARFVINGMIKHFPQHEYYLFTPIIKPEFEYFYTQNQNVKLVTPESFLGRKFSSLWRTYAIADMCTELTLDVFHGLSNELPVGIEKFEGKKIVTIHDLIFLRYPNYYNNIDRYIYTKKFKYACEKADTVIAASIQTKNDILSHFGTSENKVTVGYQNCDERFSIAANLQQKQEIQQAYKLPNKFMLCVGTIEQRKNQLTVLKAFDQLNDVNIALVFIGKQTDYADQLHQYIAERRVENRVFFLQKIPTEHLPVIYQSASLFVYASEFEGFGIPVLEGMRSGIPVIAANASSLPEVGGNVIQYFEPTDVSGLLARMKQTLSIDFNNQIYNDQLSIFDTNKLIAQLENIYSVKS
jgi:glycosyltransferase involved in cell wall biosynthesis